MPEVSIIIVNWNTRQLLADCINAIEVTRGNLQTEIIVVDNGSTDGSQALIKGSFPQIKLIENTENVGFARANNQGFAISTAPYILLLNSDAFLLPGALSRLMELAKQQPKAGLIGAQLLNADGSFQASFTDMPRLRQEFLILSGLGRLFYGRWYPSHSAEESRGPQKGGYVEGACMLIHREAYTAVSGLDETYFMYSEDVELCKSMWDHGWEVWYQPAAKVTHLGGGSSHSRKPEREADLYHSKVRYYRRHHGGVAANLLKAQIYGFTLFKIMLHRLLRLLSGGRRGRPVVSLRYLNSKLKEA
jgi:GT2 family glycosyltransferase